MRSDNHYDLAEALRLKGDFGAAAAEFRRALELNPKYPEAHRQLAETYEASGAYDQSVAENEKAMVLSGNNEAEVAALRQAYATSGIKGYRRKRLQQRLEQSKRRYVPAESIAGDYALLGEKDQAFAWLEKAYERHSDLLVELKQWYVLDSLRSDPRFQDLMRRVGLAP